MSLYDKYKEKKENSLYSKYKESKGEEQDDIKINKSNRISTYQQNKKTILREIGSSIKEDSQRKKEIADKINQEVAVEANKINSNFNAQNPQTVELPIANKNNAYNYRNVMQETAKNQSLPTKSRLSTDEEIKNFKKFQDGDMFKLTDGKIDDRNKFQKIHDDVSSIVVNTGAGMAKTFTNIANYEDSAGKQLSKTAMKYLLGNNEKTKLLANVLGEQIYDKVGRKALFGNGNLKNDTDLANKFLDTTIEKNIKKTTNPLTHKISEIAPSIGNNLVPMAVTAVNPIAGSALFMTSAGGSYLDDAKQRGMNDDQAFGYATIMGLAEGGSEAVISGSMLSKVKKAFTGKELSKTFLNSLPTEITENFAQEALMEPIQEGTSAVFGGTSDWSNMPQRMTESGVDGILSALLLKGASMGIVSSNNIIDKINKNETISEQEINIMINDLKQKDYKGYKETINGAIEAVNDKMQNNTKISISALPTNEEVLNNIYKNVENRTSKENQKNNKRIENYLRDNYPNLKIDFTNYKTDGTVEINSIKTVDEYNKNIENIKKEYQENKTKLELEKEANKYKTTPINAEDEIHLEYGKLPTAQQINDLADIREKSKELVNNLNKKGYELIYDESKSSADAFYIDVLDKNGEYKDTIRIANHFKNGVSGQYNNNIDLSEYTSKNAVIKDLNIMIDNVANKQETLYNINESESGINERNIEGYSIEGRNRLYEESTKREYSREEYEEWEQSIKPINENELTYTEKEQISKAKKEHNKEVVLFDENTNNNKYSAGASINTSNRINISRQQSEYFGLGNMIEHENVESDIIHNDVANDILTPLISVIQEDKLFNQQKLEFWKGQEGNIPKDNLIAKDLICDRFAEIKNNTKMKYNNILSNATNSTIDNALINYYYQVYGKELKINKELDNSSSFSMQNNTQNQAPTAKNNIAESSDKWIKEKNKENTEKQIAKVLNEVPDKVKESDRIWAITKANILDKGIVFEELSRKADKLDRKSGNKSDNRNLQGKWDYTLMSIARAQDAIGKTRYEFNDKTKIQKQISKSLEEIKSEVGNNSSEFQNYIYHQLNIDRMTLEERFGGDTGTNYERTKYIKNKPVFSNEITADISRQKVAEYEQKYPEFKKWAKDVYDYNNANKKELIKTGVISQELADKLDEMYPHYVPIKRIDTRGKAINVPLDTNRTGINAPLKRATGGTSNIMPLFETMADRTIQIYRASARNSFGIELKNTLKKLNQYQETDSQQAKIDIIMEEMGEQESADKLLQEGGDSTNPTFTVFENGKKVTFDITKDIYDALKPLSDSSILSKTFKSLNTIGNARRGVLTEYNPLFLITNGLKDSQDVLLNSQHATKTYMKFPEAYIQIITKGYWYNEYIANGGEQNSYFKDGKFESDKKVNVLKKVLTIPLNIISNVNGVIEMAPRLAEYIASRETGRNIETSMLDASRVTTNFKAGGDITKFANRNGATFLNASVQGSMQVARNIQEANAKGLKGWAVLAGKTIVAGLPVIILNNFIWKDDEDYEELQDYVKDNYYCVAKIGNGKFIRIPKGRVTATIQKIISNVDKYITNGKELNIDNFTKDFWEDINFAKDNVAPNNPLDNNVLSPIIQAFITNKSWYGEDLIPSRLQNKPKTEQYDETTDTLSIWLGQKLNQSPYKINYLLDQYGGGISDIILPMMTKQAENNVIEDKFTTDSTMKSKYPGEFFENLDNLKIKSNSEKATDEDILKYKYASEVFSSMSDLYKEKRQIQNSDTTDKEKKEKLKVVQEKINKLAKDGMSDSNNIKINSDTAIVGKQEYYKKTNLKTQEKEWTKLSKEEKEKNKNISLTTYYDYQEKVSQETIKQRKNGDIKEDAFIKAKDKINILINSNYDTKQKQLIYENYIKDTDDKKYDIIKSIGLDIDKYLKYKIEDSKGTFDSDKKDNGTVKGKTITNSAKNKRYNYIMNMKATYTQKVILFGLEYSPEKTDKQTIVNYILTMKGKTTKEKTDMLSKFSWITFYKDGSFDM